MVNEKRLLNDANTLFLNKEFKKALFLYSELLYLSPLNEEYKIYAIFCDIAIEDVEKALSLYDYYSVSKAEDEKGAIPYIKKVISAYDGDVESLMLMLDEFSQNTVESLDAIKYDDFKALVISRGSFRVAFEDIMFSTKVAIESKDDFFDFVSKLIENDFNTTAYSYLEGFNEYFSYDDNIQKLYKLLEEKNIALNHK
ncbi:MAG: hypothetical protein HRT41_08760 [Campylobacteraceae bacterium]|nr:hypothetical protein [Campylobacteraceae bacterium]